MRTLLEVSYWKIYSDQKNVKASDQVRPSCACARAAAVGLPPRREGSAVRGGQARSPMLIKHVGNLGDTAGAAMGAPGVEVRRILNQFTLRCAAQRVTAVPWHRAGVSAGRGN